jgi:hypothetical protein
MRWQTFPEKRFRTVSEPEQYPSINHARAKTKPASRKTNKFAKKFSIDQQRARGKKPRRAKKLSGFRPGVFGTAGEKVGRKWVRARPG